MKKFESSIRSAKVTAILNRIEVFIGEELEPMVERENLDWEKGASHDLLRQVWRRSRELGLYGIQLPEELGGAGLSVLEQVQIKEAIYASGCCLAPHIMGELSGPPRVGALYKQATPHQIEHFIKPVLEAQLSSCFALTEEEAGSDAGALRTMATRTATGWRLNGRKKYISGSPFADLAVVIASTSDDPQKRETTAFFVEASRSGYRIEAGYETMAGQSHTGDIVLENCEIPEANMIGERGRGLALAMGRISVNRLLHCPAMLGLAHIALTQSLARASTRVQFGQPIGSFQAIQHMLADMATELEAARALMNSVAQAIDRGEDPRAQSSMAKLFCSETAFRIADRAVQVHGGAGIVKGNVVEWLFRMLRMYRVLTGTSEIQRNTIAREILSS
jgi:alkylation response protein AidB-like acyl-CoA dehydrogenase